MSIGFSPESWKIMKFVKPAKTMKKKNCDDKFGNVVMCM